MMLIESIILLKNHISCNFMLKYYISVSFRQFTKTLNKFLYSTRDNKNLEIFMSVWGTFIGKFFDKLTLSLKCKISCSLKNKICQHIIFVYDCHPQWNNYLKSFILNFCTLSIPPALETKKLVFVKYCDVLTR